MKLKILFITDATFLSTGYSIYAREIMRRLHSNPNFELAELGLYCMPNDHRIAQSPWKIYPNLPANDDEKHIYDSNPVNAFGAWKFESICLDFKPNVVFDHLDIWMSQFTITSPYRKNYKLVLMPACDGVPQARQWIADYIQADAICSYTDWALGVLNEQSNGKIKLLGNTSPAADDIFKPVSNKEEHKKKYGLGNIKVIGTIMRNQKRKLFPDLFLSFRKFLDNSGRKDVVLYCHTGYPDRTPWNIPELLNDYGLSNKVLITYRCNPNPNRGGCGFTFPSFFNDYIKVCPNCLKLNATTADVHNGVDNTYLNEIYNLFDLYIQYAALEACGMPQVEAGACGIPTMAMNYSGMGEIVNKLGGISLEPLTYTKELETGRMWAVPDNDWTANKIQEFFELSDERRTEWGKEVRQNYLKHYSYDKSAALLNNYFGTINPEAMNKIWYSNHYIREPAKLEQKCEQMSNFDYTKWLILDVMGEPSMLGSYFHSRVLKDLNFNCSTMGVGGNYLNENSFMHGEGTMLHAFGRQDAYNICSNFANNRNIWEERRRQIIK